MTAWQTIDTAPKDRFILLWCPEDESRWLAKWQGGEWYGVDDEGLTRNGDADRPSAMHRWVVTHWMPLPDPPKAAPQQSEAGGRA